jgi:hypothetical protein
VVSRKRVRHRDPVAWVATNGAIAVAFGRTPPSWTWIALPVLGVPVGALAGLFPIKFRAQRWIPLIAVVFVVAGLAMALSSR